jgi:hypothetical protein
MDEAAVDRPELLGLQFRIETGGNAKGAVSAGKQYGLWSTPRRFFDRMNHDMLMDRLAKGLPTRGFCG